MRFGPYWTVIRPSKPERSRFAEEDAAKRALVENISSGSPQTPIFHRRRRQNIHSENSHEAKRELSNWPDFEWEWSSCEVYNVSIEIREEGDISAFVRAIKYKTKNIAVRYKQVIIKCMTLILIHYHFYELKFTLFLTFLLFITLFWWKYWPNFSPSNFETWRTNMNGKISASIAAYSTISFNKGRNRQSDFW